MKTEFYILKIRILSALRWIKELGFIRILISLIFFGGIYKSFIDVNNTLPGVLAIIFLNLSVIYSVHSSRRDEFFISSIGIRKRLLFSLEYLVYSVPFLLLVLISNFFLFSIYIIPLLFAIINIKSGNRLKLNFKSGKTLFPLCAFEWISGIRINFYLIAAVYLFGLIFSYQLAGGILSIIILTLIFSSFYIENEPLLFIEAYKLPAKKLLHIKIFQMIKIYVAVILPIILLHLIFFYERWYLIAGVIFICSVIMTASVLTKYAFYSEDISSSKMNYIINGVIVFSFVSSFYMTGALLFPLPFFMLLYLYKKALKNIQNVRYITL